MSTQLVGNSQTVLCVDVTGDPSGKIISGGEKGELCLWALDGTTIDRYQHEAGEDITSIVCSQRRHEILYTSMGDKVVAFDVRHFKDELFSFSFSEDEINQLALSEKDDFLAVCDDSGCIKVINLFEKRVYKTLRKHTNICATVSFRPKRPWDLFSGGYDSRFIQWDFSRGRCVCDINMEDFSDPSQLANAPSINPPFVHSISVSNSGKFLACGTENTKVELFKIHKRTPEFAANLEAHTLGVSQVHFPSFAESHLVSGGNDGKIFFWNLSSLSSGNSGSDTGQMTNGTHNHMNGFGGGEEAADEAYRPPSRSLQPYATINHSAKINWITSGNKNNQKFLVVADNSEVITLYPYND